MQGALLAEDAFPARTQKTWIERTLEQGTEGRRAVNRHVMDLYRDGLRAYLLGTSYRKLGDVDEVVSGFFADRLDREDYFLRWRNSAKRLRYWLINGFRYYLQELCSERKRTDRYVDLPEVLDGTGPDPREIVDGMFGWSCLRIALERTKEKCGERGLDVHWIVFERHELGEEPYDGFVVELGVTSKRAACMNRTVRFLFRDVMRGLFHREGATEGEIDEEIEHVIGCLASAPELRGPLEGFPS